jgi:N-sulfoglucosamine sulfohydrolase
MKACLFTPILVLFCLSPLTLAAEKPNILWITSEDNSSHWLGCYGNSQAQTPHLDALAKESILFEHAYSNAPVCAVARATILIGSYSATMGTQHMRSRHPIPATHRPNVEFLRSAGYYCTNRAKTDYNFKGNDNSYWNASSNSAHYKNRPKDKPFFAVFNLHHSHESSLFSNSAAEPQRLKPDEIDLPPYLPDLPEIRKDFARYHDRITAMDKEVGKILTELETAGLAENTIVFYYSDHGGILPRGKRYLEETGVKVPLLVRVPKKFQHLAPFQPGQRVTEPVSFVDLTPTLFSLAEIDIHKHIQGRPFLGTKRIEPAANEMEFLFADRFDELYGMRRGLSNGKWKYIRNFNPHLPLAPYSFYQFGQPGWIAYQKAWQEGKLSDVHQALWEAPKISEQLYDLAADPWEMNNLAADPAHTEKLATLREQLKTTMIKVHDSGLIPEPLFETLAGASTIAGFTQSPAFNLKKIAEIAFVASERNPENLPLLKAAINSTDPVERYWGTLGFRMLGTDAKQEVESILPLLKDSQSVIRTTAADTLFTFEKKEIAHAALLNELKSDTDDASLLYLLNILHRIGMMDQLPKNWAEGKAAQGGYIQRFILESQKSTK